MHRLLRYFICSDKGAVTADYVVLAALAVVLGVGVSGTIVTSSSDLARRIADTVSAPVSTAETGSGGSSGGGGAWAPMPDAPPEDAGAEDAEEHGGSGGPGRGNAEDGPGQGQAGDTPAGDNAANAPGQGPDGAGPPGQDGDGPPGHDPASEEPQPEPPGSGSGNAEEEAALPIVPDFVFPDAHVGFYWGNRVVSDWMDFSLNGATAFRLEGEGNPTAQAVNGQQLSEGRILWGTNIHVDTPPPGESYTVFLFLGDEVGSFTVSRAAAP